MLLIEQAQIAQSLDGSSSGKSYLPGYDGTVSIGPLFWLLFKLVVALYLVATALSKFDAKNISTIEVLVRLILAIAVLVKISEVSNIALSIAIAVLVFHQIRSRFFGERETVG